MKKRHALFAIVCGTVAAIASARVSEQKPSGTIAWDAPGCYRISTGKGSTWRPAFMLKAPPEFTDSTTTRFALVRNANDGYGTDWGVSFSPKDGQDPMGEQSWTSPDSEITRLRSFNVDWGWEMELWSTRRDTVDGIASFEAFPFPKRSRVSLLRMSCTADFTTTPSGLQYFTMSKRTGDIAKPGMTVTIHERTTLLDGSVIFDSYKSNTPISFVLGGNQVIDGVDEGVTGMHKGETRRLIVPPALSKRTSYPTNTPPDSTLRIDVQLVELKPAK